MKIVKTMLEIGATEPFQLGHFSDLHLTCVDSREDDVNLLHAQMRMQLFPQAMRDYEFILKHAKEHDMHYVCTGDLIDFITARNLDMTQKLIEETDCFVAAGNHEFHREELYHGVFETKEFKEKGMVEVQPYFHNDLLFAKREINGVNLVAIDNSYHKMEAWQIEKLKEVAAEGKPIILLLHTPLYCESLREYTRRIHGVPTVFAMGIPDRAYRFYGKELDLSNPFIATTQETLDAYDYIVNESTIKCILAGHLHFDYETLVGDKMQILTGINTLREITIY